MYAIRSYYASLSQGSHDICNIVLMHPFARAICSALLAVACTLPRVAEAAEPGIALGPVMVIWFAVLAVFGA